MHSKRYIVHNLLLRLQYTGFDDTYYVFFFLKSSRNEYVVLRYVRINGKAAGL